VYVGSRSDIDYTAGSRVTMPSYLLLNGSMLFIVKSDKDGRFLALTFRGTNLLNHGYQQTSGFSAPGRTLLVGVRVAVEQVQQQQ
jgi:outer membrane cobalamin receptor